MTTVRVATCNLYLGADLARLFGVRDLDDLAGQLAAVRTQLAATRFEERAEAVARLLVRERPDLVGLQEVARWTVAPLRPDGSTGQETELADFLSTLLHDLESLGCAYDVHAVSENLGGTMPVSATQAMRLVGANATLVRRGGPVAVLDEATASYTETYEVVTRLAGLTFPVERSWGSVDTRVDGVRLRLVNTHTEAYDPRVRDAQRDELLALHIDGAGAVVVVGDLNADPSAVGMPAGWVDAWTLGVGDGFTCGQAADLSNDPSSLAARIDYVWARDATVLGCRVVGASPGDRTLPHGLWPSDHACVVADLALS